MDQVTITINTGNDAFHQSFETELARILREIADKVKSGELPERVYDINGNAVATIETR